MIKIIDSLMGSGKTTAMIDYTKNHPEERQIFITERLDEVERIVNQCDHFYEPRITIDNAGMDVSKTNGALKLLHSGHNIATTHQLFNRFTQDMLDLIEEKKYVLIMDESIGLVSQIMIHGADMILLSKEHETIKVHPSGRIEWLDREYPDKGAAFSYLKTLSDMNELYTFNKIKLFRLLGVRSLSVFKDVWIMTYLFERQPMRYYLDAYKMKYEIWHAKDCKLYQGKSTEKYHIPINLFQKDKFNGEGLGYDRYIFSANWYSNNNNRKKVKNMLREYISYYCGSGSGDCIWTVFKRYKKDVQGKGYARGFIPLNARGTNIYGDRHNVAYVVNRFMNADVAACYRSLGIDFDNNWFALCEMLQFLWRSAIRNGEAVNVWIPSKRMRDYFVEWYNSVSDTPMKYEEPLLYSVYDEDDFERFEN